MSWLDRCYKHKTREDQLLFPIVQGNMYKDLREESVERILPYALSLSCECSTISSHSSW